MKTTNGMSRRAALKGAAGVTIVTFTAVACKRRGELAADTLREPVTLMPAYVQVSPQNEVIIVCPAAEMGQGVHSVLPAIIAEEMGADWSSVQIRQSPADVAYANPSKNSQSTGGSMSVRGYFDALRSVGAEARARLLTAAAERWSVLPDDCFAQDGFVHHRNSERMLSFSEVAVRAAELTDIEASPVKSPADFKLLGTPFLRKDLEEKVTGEAVFASDISLPGMLTATIGFSPALGGELLSFDEAAARAVRGVRHIVPTTAGETHGLAVVADTFWSAKIGLEAAAPKFSRGQYSDQTTQSLSQTLRDTVGNDGMIARDDGDIVSALEAAASRVSGVYEAPYLAHATMEPMSCVADVKKDSARIIAPTQGPARLRDEAAAFLGFAPEAVQVERTFLGGGFGRRWESDFGLQAVEISRACSSPVKLLWTREADMQHDYYRPQAALGFEAGIGADGQPSVLVLRAASASILEWGRPGRLGGNFDALGVSGLSDNLYAIPNQRVTWSGVETPVPVGFWRSVGHSQNAFFLEGVVDELAVAAGQDPALFRLHLLDEYPRMRRTLQAALKLGNWSANARADGFGQGVALAQSYGACCAYVIDVTVNGKELSINNVACALDCGFIVNPDGVRAQVEGSAIFGLTAALFGEIEIDGGAVVQSNFHDYRQLTLAETPPIAITLVESDGEMGGAGEPALPPVAPALLNAIHAATGVRLRRLPLEKHGYVLV